MGYATLTDGAYIEDTITGTKFQFQFLPDTITDSKGANFQDYPIVGRSSPLKGYQYGPSRTISFTIVMFANPTADGPGLSPGEVKQWTDFLLSLPYPDYQGGIKPPHKCLVIVGDNVGMYGVCTNASATYKSNIPWELGPSLAHGVEVALEFQEVSDDPLDTFDRRGGSF